MILQSLVQYYDSLVNQGKISEPGWNPVKISYELELDKDGNLIRVIPLKIPELKGKKQVMVPQELIVPAQNKRSSGVKANFLCDNASYILGCDNKGKKDRSLQCFNACKELHNQILSTVNHPAAQAILQYFDKWNPEKTMDCVLFKDYLEDVLGNANFVFSYDGNQIHTIPEIKKAWMVYRTENDKREKKTCLVTGELGAVATLHPSIKGIRGAQSSGASLVSFNAPAFCSYGKEQGENSPTSESAAFAYGAALNYLISDKKHVQYIGDTIVLCWSITGKEIYQDFWFDSLFGESIFYEESDFLKMAKDIVQGRAVEIKEEFICPDTEFYVLGIAPNAARLSVRFFYKNTFGELIRNILMHHERLNITIPSFVKNPKNSLWSLLQETVNNNSKEKNASPVLAGELLRSVLGDTLYPAGLLNGITLRVRADHIINYRRAAIIKAYYLKNENKEVPKEVLTVSLNENSSNEAYNLGRLFAVLEMIQQKANPSINSTIRDKYFNSASATPAHIFPTLIKLSQSHLKVIRRNNGEGVYTFYTKKIQEVTDLLPEEFSKRMSLPKQGAFQLGYYHQVQAFYAKKEEV